MEERGSESGDKTEEATDERRRQYREEGNVASPREVVSAVSLGLCLIIFSFASKNMYSGGRDLFSKSFSFIGKDLTLNEARILNILAVVMTPILPWVVASGVALYSIPLATGMLLTRFNFTWKPIMLNFEKLNPISGMQKLFGTRVLIEFMRSFLKFLILLAIIFVVIKSEISASAKYALYDTKILLSIFYNEMFRVIMAVLIGGGVIGLADYSFNWWKLENEMKMTKEDLKREMKNQEGDPTQKGLRRRMARDFATRKTISEAVKATFIVTNPQHFAVALRYKKGMTAPVVIAKGQDFLALKIREIAKKNDIIIVENKPLARTLYKTVKTGQEIPSSLYASVIEVIKYIYKIRGAAYFERFDKSEDILKKTFG